jgi:glycine cleavage system aminomethyltransferase T
VSFEFLTPAESALARSPMEREAVRAGAQLELRDGWNVAASFGNEERERERCRSSVGFADRAHLGKIEVQADAGDLARIAAGITGGAPITLGQAESAGSAWWCPYSSVRSLVLCEPGDTERMRRRIEEGAASCNGPVSVIDVTAAFAAIAVAGPLAGELFARFSAIDLRPAVTPVRGWRPGSVARTPGAILRETEGRYLMLFGAALGRYMWTVVADAAQSLGGGPVGVDVIADA